MRAPTTLPARVLSVVLLLLSAAARAACVPDQCPGSFNPCLIRACVQGECGFVANPCDDRDACTDDGCNALTIGCFHVPACPSDGIACNGEEFCGFPFPTCYRTGTPDCNDGSACTIDSCVEPNGCRHVSVDCNDGNPCTEDSCDASTGCVHTAVDGCCRTGTDCPTDACTIRLCQNTQCTAGTPVSCDDGSPLTIDACDPATGCTHTQATTTTTLPGAGCSSDTECPADAEPCTVEVCDAPNGCVSRPATGFETLACICRRPPPPACAGSTLPAKILGASTRACTLIHRAGDATGKRLGKLVGRARRQLATARRRTLGRAAAALPADCRDALGGAFADGLNRIEAFGRTP